MGPAVDALGSMGGAGTALVTNRASRVLGKPPRCAAANELLFLTLFRVKSSM